MKKIIAAQIILVIFAGVFLFFSSANAQYNPISPLPGMNPEGTFVIANYVPLVVKLSIALAALLAVVMLVAAGFMYITAAGSPGTLEKAKKYAFDAIVGLLIAIGYWLILSAINPAILGGDIPSLPGAPPGGVDDVVGGGGPTGPVGGGGGAGPAGETPIYSPGEPPDFDPDSVDWSGATIDWRGTDAERDPFVHDGTADTDDWSWLTDQDFPLVSPPPEQPEEFLMFLNEVEYDCISVPGDPRRVTCVSPLTGP